MKKHTISRRRLLVYVIFGVVLAITSWYFPSYSQTFALPAYLFELFILSMWVLPALGVAIFETTHSNHPINPAIAASAFWTTATTIYYLYYAYLLAIPGLPQLEFLRLAAADSPYFRLGWMTILQATLIPQVLKWVPTGIIGGLILGWLTGFVYMQLRRKTNTDQTLQIS